MAAHVEVPEEAVERWRFQSDELHKLAKASALCKVDSPAKIQKARRKQRGYTRKCVPCGAVVANSRNAAYHQGAKCGRHESWLYEGAKGSGVFDVREEDLPANANRGKAFFNCQRPAAEREAPLSVSAFKAAWRKARAVTADNF